MTIEELAARLVAAQQAHASAVKAWHRTTGRDLRASMRSPEAKAQEVAYQTLLEAERALAAARTEEYAEAIDCPVKWDVGAPLPHLVMNGHRCFLAFCARVPDPNWDGTYATMKDPASGASESLALVEFERCITAKLGAPNDEVFHGHPLHGRGAEAYSAQRVRNSRWLAEIEKLESVHPGYNAKTWRSLTHFVFWFHDTTFECIAKSFTVERHSTSMRELAIEMARRVVGDKKQTAETR